MSRDAEQHRSLTGVLRSIRTQSLGIGILASVDITLGAAILLGSPERVAGVSFQTAKMIAPLNLWAVVILIFGTLTLTATVLQTRLTPWHGRIAVGIPCALAAGWHTFWASAFAATALDDPNASLTGIPAYGGYAAMHLIVAVREQD